MRHTIFSLILILTFAGSPALAKKKSSSKAAAKISAKKAVAVAPKKSKVAKSSSVNSKSVAKVEAVKTVAAPEVPKTNKQIMVIKLDDAKSRRKPASSTSVTVKLYDEKTKSGKEIVQVAFGGNMADSDLEPLAKSVNEADKENRKKKTNSEIENKFVGRTTDKAGAIQVKGDAEETVSVPDASSQSELEAAKAREVASAKTASKAVDMTQLLKQFKKHAESEIDHEDYSK